MVKQSSDPVTMLEDQLTVKVVADDILEVSLTGNQLDDMKVIIDHLVKRYVDEANAFDSRERSDQVKKLDQFATKIRLDIEETEKHIELLGKANGTLGGDDNALWLGLLKTRLVTADAEYNQLGREIIGLESELDVYRKQLENKDAKIVPPQSIVNQEIARNPVVMKAEQLWKDEKDRMDRDRAKATDPDKDPHFIEWKAKVEKLQLEYEQARKSAEADALIRAREIERGNKEALVAALATRLEVQKVKRERVKDDQDFLQKQITAGVGGGFGIQNMRDALKPKREQLDRVNAHLEQLRLTQTLDGRVSPRGEPEKIPNNNQIKKMAMSGAGGLASFFGVVLLVAFLEWRTRRVDGVDQVVTELGMRVIGTVPAFPNRANLKAAVEAGGANWRFVLNESINSARTMLLHTARTQSMQVVMVTSATQGEGKTSLASQLATSMATAGMRTLVVDCDLRNPSIQKLFELPLGPGVSEVLRQEVDVSDAVQATAVPNLWVITAGQCSNATIAALAQGHPMETLFNRLRGQFDFVIVDSCPVLPVADALLIGQHVDGVVFSIMQDVSQLPKVMTATEKLNQLNIPLVGAVVNGIKQDVYSYGYNYVKQLPA
jgi:capsular exopolysaccharide synthesis family protein